MFCCKNHSDVPVELPFKRFISLDYYDGPATGFTICMVCHSTFYFRLIKYDADEDVKFCRMFEFSKIEIDFDEIYEFFKKGYQLDSQEIKGFIKTANEKYDLHKFTSKNITNICVSDDSVNSGRKPEGRNFGKFW